MMLRREYCRAVEYLNQNVPEEKKLRFIHWDFHKFAKRFSSASWLPSNICKLVLVHMLMFDVSHFTFQQICKCTGCFRKSCG
jgi:hypothetical protein